MSATLRSTKRDFAQSVRDVLDMMLYCVVIVVQVVLVGAAGDPALVVQAMLLVCVLGLFVRLLDVALDAYFWNMFLFWFAWNFLGLLYYLVHELMYARAQATSLEEDRAMFLWQEMPLHVCVTVVQFLIALAVTSNYELFLSALWSRVLSLVLLLSALLPFANSNSFASLWMTVIRVVVYCILFACVYRQYQTFVEGRMITMLVERRVQLRLSAEGSAATVSEHRRSHPLFTSEELGRRSVRSIKLVRTLIVVLCLSYVLFGYFYVSVVLALVHALLVASGILGGQARFSLEKKTLEMLRYESQMEPPLPVAAPKYGFVGRFFAMLTFFLPPLAFSVVCCAQEERPT